MKRRWSQALALAVLVGSLSVEGRADAATLTCGQVIVQDTVLDADVGPCPGPGIIIGASGITLDLGGHTVFGASSSTSSGLLVENQRAGVRVRNGTVTGFQLGISGVQVVGSTFEGLIVRNNRCHGIEVLGFGSAGFLTAARENTMRGNVIRENGCSGVRLFQRSESNLVERNAITGNAGSGVFLELTGPNNSPRSNTVRQNSITSNGGDGITDQGFFNTFSGNVIRGNAGNGVNIVNIFGGSDTVQGNQVTGNGANGIVVRFGRTGVQVVGNTSTGNASVDLVDENPQCSGNTWSGNIFGTRNQTCIS